VYFTLKVNKTTYNSPEYKGRDFIHQTNYYKTINSNPQELTAEVLQQLRQCGFDYEIVDNDIYLSYMGERHKVTHNRAKERLYKLMLVGSYGKFGQSQDQVQHKVVNNDDFDRLTS